MRRLLAILTLCAMNIWFVVPAVGTETAQQLPACCRTHGAHHCSAHGMVMPERGAASGHAIDTAARCPYFPVPDECAAISKAGFPIARRAFAGHITNRFAQQPQLVLRRRASAPSSVFKRGPPSLS